jgi:ELWxxDGT repeat protein
MARRWTASFSFVICLALLNAMPPAASAIPSLPPSVITSFSPQYVALNGTSTLGFAINDPNGYEILGVDFTDNLPSGVQVGPSPSVDDECGGTVTADPGSSSVTLSNGDFGPGVCVIYVTVVGTSKGDKDNHLQVTWSAYSSNVAHGYVAVGAPHGAAKLVKDTNPGSNDGMGLAIAVMGKNAYFPATDGVHGMELWRSDGTRAGTRMVKDIDPGSAGALDALFFGGIASVNGTLFFSANDGTHGIELWKSNGTASGTKMVKDINPGGDSSPRELTNVDGTLFFSANDGTHGFELWKSDGTASGTKMVKDINPNSDSIPEFLTNFGGTLVFIANDGTHGVELWKSNGTSAGTQLVRDINPSGDGFPFLATQLMPFFTSIKGTLYFVADNGTLGPQLWRSNGTKAGTRMVRAITPPGSAPPTGLMNFNGALFFSADDGIHGPELWRSNGTSAGTRMVKDINPGADGSYPSGMTDFGGILIFSSDVGTHYGELWRSDGTSSGTRLVRDINPVDGAFPIGFRDIGGTLLFQAQDPDFGTELYRSDGTRAGTKLVDDINVSGGSGPNLLVDVGGRLLFSASDLSHGNELWRYKP